MKVAFCFDLDGTLTQEEILPQIARHVDLTEEIELLTSITMQGMITFGKSFKLRVKLLSQVPVETVRETVNNIRIEPGLRTFVQEFSDHCFIVTGNLDIWINELVEREFGCRYFSSIADFQDNTLKGVREILDKKDAIEKLRKEGYDMIIAIGDGMNDCSMFEKADLGIAFGGVHEPVYSLIQLSNYVCYDAESLSALLESLFIHFSNEN